MREPNVMGQNASHFCCPPMTIDRYAAFQCATGVKAFKDGSIWWQQVRPFFHRPLLPHEKYDLKNAENGFSKIGTFQYCVSDGQSHNSYLNPIVFDQLQQYDVKKLRDDVRRNINKALKNDVRVTRFVDEEEFSEKAYPVYVSFYERTKYAFDTTRRQKDMFSRWAHTLFQFPEALVLGAFVAQELVSFEIRCLVKHSLIVKTTVHSGKGLKVCAPDLLLHHSRMSVVEQPEIHRIYDSMLGQNLGVNEFKIHRGARVLSLPAFLRIHPLVLALIGKASKNIHRRLRGLSNDELVAAGISRHFESDTRQTHEVMARPA